MLAGQERIFRQADYFGAVPEAAQLRELEVRVYDNSDLRRPYLHLATFRFGKQVFAVAELPDWLTQAVLWPSRVSV